MSPLVQSVVALLAITNPVGAAILFLSLTGDASAAARRRMAVRASVAVVLILAAATVAGPAVLKAFGISLPAFQAGGGLVILLMGLEMLRGTPARANTSTSSGAKSAGAESSGAESAGAESAGAEPAGAESAGDSILVPFAMPLVAGPGSITTVITLASHRAASGGGAAETLLAVAVAGLVLLAVLLGADRVGRSLGGHGQGIVLRFMGLILVAIGVQMVLTGVHRFGVPALG